MSVMLVVAAGGALTGYGVFLAGRHLLHQAPDLGADLTALFAAPPESTTSAVRGLPGRLCRLLRDHGLERLLLSADVRLAGRSEDGHMAARLLHLLAGTAAGLACAALAGVVSGLPPLLSALLLVGGMLAGVTLADRPVRRLAHVRRRDAALATAAYVDLVRILLVGGLPLPAALTAAADSGRGWTFACLRDALADARTRGIPADVGFAGLAVTYPLREFTDLARTVSAARSGASPVLAFESRAAAIRHADTARQRAAEAAVDAQMDLPAAVVALAFVAFLTYPLLTMINSGVGL